jgi:hypothetical protein
MPDEHAEELRILHAQDAQKLYIHGTKKRSSCCCCWSLLWLLLVKVIHV